MFVAPKSWILPALIALALIVTAGPLEFAVAESRFGTPSENSKVISELLNEASAAVNAIDDSEKKAVAFLALATAQARAGDRPAAQGSIQESIAAIRTLGDISGPENVRLPGVVAIRQAEIDDLSGALQTIKSIPDAGTRDFARNGVIEVLLAHGAHKQALDVSRSIENAFMRELNLSFVAEAKARHGDLDAALSIVNELEKSEQHASAMTMLILARLQAGDVESAQQLTSTIDNSLHKLRALYEIAKAQLAAQKNDAARQTYREAQQLAIKAKLPKVPGVLVVLQAQLGDVQGALAAVDALDDPAERTGITKQILLWLAGEGQIAQAVGLVPKIKDDPRKDHTLRELAVFLAKAGEIAAGLETASRLEDAYARSYAFREIAKVQFEKGNHVGAKTSLAEALKATVNFPVGGGTNVIMLQEVAAAQAQTGDVEAARRTFLDALKTTESYPDLSYRGQLAGDIAKAEAAAGLADAAAEWALKPSSPGMRAPALLGVVDGILAKAGNRGK